MSLAERRDARRLAMAAGAAVLVHVALFVAVPFLTSLDAAPLPDYGPVVIRIELPEAVLEPPPPAPRPVPAPVPAPVPRPTTRTATAPAARPATAPTVAATAPAAPVRPAGTSAFRQSGATTGTSTGSTEASIVTGPPPVSLPAVGTTTPGGGEQRGGEAVSLTSRPAGGTLDTRTLQQSLAGTATSGTATGAPGAAPATDSGKPAASSDADIAWKNPDAAKGRTTTFVQAVPWPDWVKGSGQELEVIIEFSVDADGVVTSLPPVLQSSGYGDVDNACLTALRKYRFTPSRGAAAIQGVAVFTTVLKR